MDYKYVVGHMCRICFPFREVPCIVLPKRRCEKCVLPFGEIFRREISFGLCWWSLVGAQLGQMVLGEVPEKKLMYVEWFHLLEIVLFMYLGVVFFRE